MKKHLKRILKFRLDFRQAVLIAILLHLLLFAIFDNDEGVALLSLLQDQQNKVYTPPDEMDFKFVEVPNDISEANPDAREWSDKDRIASTPDPNPMEGAPLEPSNRGETPEAMLSRSQIANPESSKVSESKKDELIEKSKEELQEDINKWEQEKTSDEVRAEELLNDYKQSNSDKNLSKEDLNKYFNFQDFDNNESSITRQGGLQFDTKGFDFGRWIRDFYYKVYSNWTIPLAFESLRQSGELRLSFYVHRDGSVTNIRLIDTSGLEPYDDAALNAIARSNPFLSLPEGYPDDKMEVKCRFIYRWNPAPRGYRRPQRRRYR